MLFNIAELDGWGNAKDWYDVNNLYRTDEYSDVDDADI